MRETVTQVAENDFDVRTERRKFRRNLVRRVVRACRQAPHVTIDDQGEVREFVELETAQGRENRQHSDDDLIHHCDPDEPNCVTVESEHDYPLLIALACREITKYSYGVDAREAARLLSEDGGTIEWFLENLERHTNHEHGHFFGATEHTELVPRLGVEFFVEDGIYYNFHPFVEYTGAVVYGILRDFVLCGPDKLSSADRRLLATK